MNKTIIELKDDDSIRIEAILMDSDKDEVLMFIKEVLKPVLRSKTSSALDKSKSTGIMP